MLSVITAMIFTVLKSFKLGFRCGSVWRLLSKRPALIRMGFVFKRFYETYAAAPEKLRQLVAEIPWGHNILIMQRIKDEKNSFVSMRRMGMLSSRVGCVIPGLARCNAP